MTTTLVVQVLDPRNEDRFATHVYSDSPVTVGSGPENLLRIDDARVPARGGIFFFTRTCVKYVDLSAPVAQLASPPITFGADSEPLRLGPFMLAPRLHAVDEPRPESWWRERAATLAELNDGALSVVRGLLVILRALPAADLARAAEIVIRATTVMNIIAQTSFELRGDTKNLGRLVSSHLRRFWDPLEVTNYLLDPQSSSLVFDELSQSFPSHVC